MIIVKPIILNQMKQFQEKLKSIEDKKKRIFITN